MGIEVTLWFIKALMKDFFQKLYMALATRAVEYFKESRRMVVTS